MKANEENIKQLKKFLIHHHIEPTLEPIMEILECLEESSFATEHIFLILKRANLHLKSDWIISDETDLEEAAFFYPIVHFLSNHLILKEMIELYTEKIIHTEKVIQKINEYVDFNEMDQFIQNILLLLINSESNSDYIKKTYWRKENILLKKEKTSNTENKISLVSYILMNSKTLLSWQMELLTAFYEEYCSLKPLDETKYLVVSWGEYWKDYFLTSSGYEISIKGMFEVRKQVLFFIAVIENIISKKKKEDFFSIFYLTDLNFFHVHERLIPETVREYFQLGAKRPNFEVQYPLSEEDIVVQNKGFNYKNWKYAEELIEVIYNCLEKNVIMYIEIYNRPMKFEYDGNNITREYL